MTLTLFAAATVTLAIAAGAQAPPASASKGARTGMIVGQVVDPATGTPVSEAMVRLVMPAFPEELDTTPRDRVVADNEGRFFFTELPPGDYVLEATKDGYARGAYGQRRPWGQSQRVTLGEGERRSDLELPVWKYAVIGGTVVDEAGDPWSGSPSALPREVYAGRTRFGNRQVIPELVPSTTTDDRGMFRLSRLSPGTYVVVVPSTHTTLPATALSNTNTTVRNGALSRGGAGDLAARPASHNADGGVRADDAEPRADPAAANARGPDAGVPNHLVSRCADAGCRDTRHPEGRGGADGSHDQHAPGAGRADLGPSDHARRIGASADGAPARR